MYDIPRSTPPIRIDSDNQPSVVTASITVVLLFVAMIVLEQIIGLLSELTVSASITGLMILSGGMLSVAAGLSKDHL